MLSIWFELIVAIVVPEVIWASVLVSSFLQGFAFLSWIPAGSNSFSSCSITILGTLMPFICRLCQIERYPLELSEPSRSTFTASRTKLRLYWGLRCFNPSCLTRRLSAARKKVLLWKKVLPRKESFAVVKKFSGGKESCGKKICHLKDSFAVVKKFCGK